MSNCKKLKRRKKLKPDRDNTFQKNRQNDPRGDPIAICGQTSSIRIGAARGEVFLASGRESGINSKRRRKKGEQAIRTRSKTSAKGERNLR